MSSSNTNDNTNIQNNDDFKVEEEEEDFDIDEFENGDKEKHLYSCEDCNFQDYHRGIYDIYCPHCESKMSHK